MKLTEIFPEEDFRLKMRFERGVPAEFFRRSSEAGNVLKERKKCLSEAVDVCTAMAQEGGTLLDEVLELAESWNTLIEDIAVESIQDLPPLSKCRWLCERWETDFLLLKPGADGKFRLVGGGLCFPSHWDLRSKMGGTIAEIHGPVPRLNASLGASIDGFLNKIRPGISWERHNWGLSRSPELNQHPDQEIPTLDDQVALEEVWWRLEDQSLIALPKTGGVLFGIRVTVHPLKEIKTNSAARKGLIQALETMPDEMVRYKGIENSRQRICELLGS